MAKFIPCALALLLLSGCQNVPKYKRSSGRFDEWVSYQGKNFTPIVGTLSGVDLSAQTITVTRGTKVALFPVTPETRIMHEGTDITLAQLPLNQTIKFTLSADGQRLLTIWYGTHTFETSRAGGVHRR
jgi:hypothetical protein